MSDTVQNFETSTNILRAILWQYEDAEKLLSLARAKQYFVDKAQSEFWSNWYRDVFNVDTANDFGLSVWSKILEIPLGYEAEAQPDKVAFGFGPYRKNFQPESNFGNRTGGFQSLSVDQKRILIKLRYVQLTHRPSVPIINEALQRIFVDGRGTQVYVYDNYEMEFAAYVFNQEPGQAIREILENFDILPRPSGVGVAWIVEREESFGFSENRRNFNNGNFGA